MCPGVALERGEAGGVVPGGMAGHGAGRWHGRGRTPACYAIIAPHIVFPQIESYHLLYLN
jgi:hypothetical protein